LTASDDIETLKKAHSGRKGQMNHWTDAKKGIKFWQQAADGDVIGEYHG
jgi:hypothetical protein